MIGGMVALWGALASGDVGAQPDREQRADLPRLIDTEIALSRFGVLQALAGEESTTLTFNGRAISIPQGDSRAPVSSGEFRAAVRMGSRDVFLTEADTGAAACPIVLVIIEATQTGVRASEPFGNCTRLATLAASGDRMWIRPHAWFWPNPDYVTRSPRRRAFVYAGGKVTLHSEQAGSATLVQAP